MKSYLFKMTLVILIVSTLIGVFKEKNKKILVDNTVINNIALKSELSRDNLVVYEGLTLNELTLKVDKNLASTLDGYGKIIITKALEANIDPVVAVSIILEETGCKWNCSNLVTMCNNIGGMRGKGCNGYAYFDSLEAGIEAFINNLSNNYYQKGLNTPELINKKYATNKEWYKKIEYYMEAIMNS